MSDIIDNKAHYRFELEAEGHVAKSFYEIDNGVITFLHTEVPAELGGKGIGSRLIKGALGSSKPLSAKTLPIRIC